MTRKYRYGEKKIKYLKGKFLPNQKDAINGMRKIIDDQTTCPEKIMPKFCNFLKTFPRSTAECERDFSVMNIICTDVRSKLTINNISNLMFININDLLLHIWDPECYDKVSW